MSMLLICTLHIPHLFKNCVFFPKPHLDTLSQAQKASYLNFKTLNNLSKKGLVKGFPSVSFSKEKLHNWWCFGFSCIARVTQPYLQSYRVPVTQFVLRGPFSRPPTRFNRIMHVHGDTNGKANNSKDFGLFGFLIGRIFLQRKHTRSRIKSKNYLSITSPFHLLYIECTGQGSEPLNKIQLLKEET